MHGYLHCLNTIHFLLAKKTCLQDLISLQSGRLKAEERVWALWSGNGGRGLTSALDEGKKGLSPNSSPGAPPTPHRSIPAAEAYRA